MASLNRWVGTGRLGKDIEVKKTQSDLSVCSFQIACDRAKSKNDAEAVTDWITCVAWRQSADYLGQYAHKGDVLGVDGSIQTRNYDDAQGKRHYITEVKCDRVTIISSRNGQSSTAVNNGSQTAYNEPQESPAKASIKRSEIDTSASAIPEISSDDLPF
jgi:single-strand DNA-binding protein